MIEDPVVLALRAAIERSDAAALRLTLGSHLLRSGCAIDALFELEVGLRIEPANQELLVAAADAANAAGDAGKATAYRLAAGAGRPPFQSELGPASTAPSAPATPASTTTDAAGDRARIRPQAARLHVVASGGEIEENVAHAVTFAKATAGFSGADLAAVVDAALDLAIEKSVVTGRELPVNDALLLAALSDLRPSTRPWLETARNYAVYANEGGTYDDLLEHLQAEGLA